MRKKRLIPYFNNSQKIRVIVNGVGLYMTIGELETRFATTDHRVATWFAVEGLGRDRLKDPNVTGLGVTYKSYDYKMRPTAVQVQVDLL